MEPLTPDYLFIQRLFQIGKCFAILQFKSKLSRIIKVFVLIFTTAMLCLSYYSFVIYWKLDARATNRFIYVFWYLLQLMFLCKIFLNHFRNQTSRQTLLKQFKRIEFLSNKSGYTTRPLLLQNLVEITLNISVLFFEFIEWMTGNTDMNTSITILQWQITTLYMCIIFLIVRNIAAYVHRRLNFINDYLANSFSNNVHHEENIMIQLNKVRDLITDIQEFIGTFNHVFGFDLFFYMNIVVVFCVNTYVFAFKKLEKSLWDDDNKEQIVLFHCFVLYYVVSINNC